MQILITDDQACRTTTLNVSRWQIGLVLAALVSVLLLFSGAVYHFIFLTAVRDNWPVVSQVVKWVVRDETAQRDRVMRDNLDAMAQRVGEMQARIVQLESLSDRVSELAGIKPADIKALRPSVRPASDPGSGGPYIALGHPGTAELMAALDQLGERADEHGDLLKLAESRQFESRLLALMVPNTRPVDVPVGSGFGFRLDPFTGRPALHTGLDFAADVGTPIVAAAGGVVVTVDVHPQYGRRLEIDHGNGLLTRYAHTSQILVQPGTLVKRGQQVALVGNTGRSTGAHLHFEVLIDGVPQNPARFLAGKPPTLTATRTPTSTRRSAGAPGH